MMPSLRQRWRAMREDARKTIEIAFHDGIVMPTRVPEYRVYTKRVGKYEVEFHHFRVGYVKFVIVLIGSFPPILWDLNLEDGLPIYPI